MRKFLLFGLLVVLCALVSPAYLSPTCCDAWPHVKIRLTSLGDTRIEEVTYLASRARQELEFLLTHDDRDACLARAERESEDTFVVSSWYGYKEILFYSYAYVQERYLLLVVTDGNEARHHAILEYPDLREVNSMDVAFTDFRELSRITESRPSSE